jgi:methionyl-tRNA synthetase
VFGNNAKDTGIPSDIFRFYLLYVRPESQDSSFSWADLATKNNSELLNNLGNFVNRFVNLKQIEICFICHFYLYLLIYVTRALMFTGNFFESLITPVVIEEEEKLLLGLISRELKGYISSLEKCKLRDGIRYILNISRHGNQYMQSNQPWVLVKGSENEKLVNIFLY